jgi:hypothetical protein
MKGFKLHPEAYADIDEEKPLWVVAILHGHRSPAIMASILKKREN